VGVVQTDHRKWLGDGHEIDHRVIRHLANVEPIAERPREIGIPAIGMQTSNRLAL
jgi:hypothetical protein